MSTITKEIIENMEKGKQPFICINFWFEGGYMVEVLNGKEPVLFEFEPCSEKYNYKGEYDNFWQDMKEHNSILIANNRYEYMFDVIID